MARFVKRGTELKAKLDRLRKVAAEDAEAGLLAAGAIVTAAQKRLAPVRTGRLRDSIGYELSTGAKTGNAAVRITAKAPHAHLVEFGTAPHVITPSTAEALQIGGNQFAEEVQHPGAAAKPFFFPGYRSSRRSARSAIGKKIKEGVAKAVR